jgi:hypothetical protein
MPESGSTSGFQLFDDGYQFSFENCNVTNAIGF